MEERGVKKFSSLLDSDDLYFSIKIPLVRKTIAEEANLIHNNEGSYTKHL